MIPDRKDGGCLIPGQTVASWASQDPGIEPFDPLGAVGDASAPGGGIGSLGELEMLLQVSFYLQK